MYKSDDLVVIGNEDNVGIAMRELRKGEEMGRFLLGSTVVMLFPKCTLRFSPGWAAAGPVRLGEAMGQMLSQ